MNLKVVFHNLDKSDFVESAVADKLERVIEKFPDFSKATATVSVSMENSHEHSGKDFFIIKMTLVGAHKRPLVIQKDGSNPYEALARVSDRLLDVLSRYGGKKRTVKRHSARSEKEKRKWSQGPSAA